MENNRCLSLSVTFIGRPNSGKSSLINAILGRQINIVSSTCQSTRDVIDLLFEDEDFQLIMVDTPGINKPLDELGRFIKRRTDNAIKQADFVVFLTSIEEFFGFYDRQICSLLDSKKEKIALITKIDTINSPKRLAERVEELKKIGFENIFSCSIKFKDSIIGFINQLKIFAREDNRIVVDDPFLKHGKDFFVREAIRSSIYSSLSKEIPHGIAVLVRNIEEGESIVIDAIIFVQRNSQLGILIGKGGRKISEIKDGALKRLREFFKLPIYLNLKVKISKN